MLQTDGFTFNTIAIDFDREFDRIFLIGRKHGSSLIAIVVQAALLIGDTDSGDENLRSVVLILLADVAVAFFQGVFEHAGHLAILIDITNLRRCLKLLLHLFSFSHFPLLIGKSSFELLSFLFDFGHSRFLFLHLFP